MGSPADRAFVADQPENRCRSLTRRGHTADASHELRSPITSIQTAAEVIGRHASSPDNEELAGHIVAEANRMERLIGGLLALARADGLTVPRNRPVELADVVDEVLAGTGEDRFQVSIRGGSTIDGDRDQLLRLVRNLVDNASRHADSRVAIDIEACDSSVVLRVDDDGDGIDENDRERVFDRFTRLDASRGRDDGGSGLGLALVQAIAARHNGSVSIETSPGLGGASVVVTFS